MEKELLEKYAHLVVRKGVNVQKGQPVFITVPVEGADFGRLLTEQAYKAGAKEVHVEWVDDRLSLLKYTYAEEDVLQQFPQWEIDKREAFAERGGAFISVYASNPDLLEDIDPSRVAMVTKASGEALTKFRSYLMNDEVTWTVVSIPTADWAQKIFPDQTKDEAVESLWREMVKTVRIDEADPLAAWDAHNETLHDMRKRLNDKQYEKVILTAPGTNLEVGLPNNHIWHGGAAESAEGTIFNPNMPTEEVFCAPHKYKVSGTVASTKPLHYGGSVIDQFSLTFEEGKVVDFSAEQGEDVLAHLLKTDDGAKRLGEIALVPHESPISQSGIVFYNTLFDENASCHLALGKAYPTNVEKGAEMDEAALDEHGINDSMVHVDFMIGSEKMQIEGVLADGTTELIFENGTWSDLFNEAKA